MFVYFIFDGSFICRFLYIFRPSSVPGLLHDKGWLFRNKGGLLSNKGGLLQRKEEFYLHLF